MVNVTPRPFYPRERDSVPITQVAVCALESVLTGVEYLARTGIRSLDRPDRAIKLHISCVALNPYLVVHNALVSGFDSASF